MKKTGICHVYRKILPPVFPLSPASWYLGQNRPAFKSTAPECRCRCDVCWTVSAQGWCFAAVSRFPFQKRSTSFSGNRSATEAPFGAAELLANLQGFRKTLNSWWILQISPGDSAGKKFYGWKDHPVIFLKWPPKAFCLYADILYSYSIPNLITSEIYRVFK